VFNLNEQAPLVAINIDMIPKQGKIMNNNEPIATFSSFSNIYFSNNNIGSLRLNV